MVSGWITPAAIPCINRPKLSASSVSEIPLIIEPKMKMVIIIALVRRSPKMEMNQAADTIPAVIAAKYPEDSNCALSRPIPKAPMMSGKATLTVVIERTTVMAPTMLVTVANHRYAGPYLRKRSSIVSVPKA